MYIMGKYQFGQCTMKKVGKQLAVVVVVVVVVVGNYMLGRCWSARHFSNVGY